MSRVNRALMVPIALGLIGLAACVIIPIPVDHTRGRVVDPKTPIEIGVTTKEEIVARAGKPDAVYEDERVFAYHWEQANWLIVGVALDYSSTAHYKYAYQTLLIQFDESGRVARAKRLEGMTDDTDVKEWVNGKADAKP